MNLFSFVRRPSEAEAKNNFRIYICSAMVQPDKDLAEGLAAVLRSNGYTVFAAIEGAQKSSNNIKAVYDEILKADLFIYLISAASVRKPSEETVHGSFCLTELKVAMDRWPNPGHHVLPVLIQQDIDISQVPAYIRSTTNLFVTKGNMNHEVAMEVDRIVHQLFPSRGHKATTASKSPVQESTHELQRETKPVNPPAPSDGKDYLFVSYKREDMSRIVPFLHRIVGLGYSIWYDRGIKGGKEWNAVIDEKVCGCKALLVFLSQAAVDSKMVRREIILADSENLPILGVRLDAVIEFKHGLKGIMTQYQTIDASDADFSDQLKLAIENIRIL
ncbi:MAG: toll/interleukin-1 receptor domain-containing protein [Kiritimatiellia bacterium]